MNVISSVWWLLRNKFTIKTIGRKLFLMVLVLLSSAMLFFYLVNISLTIRTELVEARSELELLADITSHNLEASLLFKDSKGTQEVLDSLTENPNIIYAEVKNKEGQKVAFFSHQIKVSNLGKLSQVLPVPQIISVNRSILMGEQDVGSLAIEMSLIEMWQLFLVQFSQLAAIMIGVLLLGAYLTKKLSQHIISPIAKVASVAAEIKTGNYGLRVPVENDDEVGEMSIALNLMLNEIESRDQALRVAAVAFQSQEGIFVTDANLMILKVNHSFTTITGYSAEEAVGQTPKILKSDKQDSNFYSNMWFQINISGTWQGEIWNRRKNGDIYPEWLTITAVKNMKGGVTHYVATLVDISERKEAERKIAQLAFYDPLTQLPNRRLLVDRMSQRLASTHRTNRIGALMFIDLDNFKNLNDTLGHNFGDLLLQQVAERLSSCVREDDTVARLGGDEFVVLLDNLSDNWDEAMSQSQAISEKILSMLNQPYQLLEHECLSTPSIGVTLFSGQKFTLDEIMKRADMAMYQAKNAGRNTLRFFEPNFYS